MDAFADLRKMMPSARALGAPILIVLILAMMLVPLPPLALDLLFSFNIAVSLVVHARVEEPMRRVVRRWVSPPRIARDHVPAREPEVVQVA